LIVRGDYEIVTLEGEVIESGDGAVALCRCGRSSTKPLCDGSHRTSGFRSVIRGTSTPPPGAGPTDS
jgi:CDGSH-type Zn-finger protein